MTTGGSGRLPGKRSMDAEGRDRRHRTSAGPAAFRVESTSGSIRPPLRRLHYGGPRLARYGRPSTGRVENAGVQESMGTVSGSCSFGTKLSPELRLSLAIGKSSAETDGWLPAVCASDQHPSLCDDSSRGDVAPQDGSGP